MVNQVQVYSNYFKVTMDEQIFKYNLTLEQGTPKDYIKEIRETIFRNAENRKKISEAIGENFIFLNNSFYSLVVSEEPLEFEMSNKVKLKIEHDKTSSFMDEMRQNLIGRMIKLIQKKVRLK